jgi:hypothetical protein
VAGSAQRYRTGEEGGDGGAEEAFRSAPCNLLTGCHRQEAIAAVRTGQAASATATATAILQAENACLKSDKKELTELLVGTRVENCLLRGDKRQLTEELEKAKDEIKRLRRQEMDRNAQRNGWRRKRTWGFRQNQGKGKRVSGRCCATHEGTKPLFDSRVVPRHATASFAKT